VPGYLPPCYSTVRDTLLPAVIKEIDDKLRSALHGNHNFTISTDIWTSRRGHPFIAFICTYINANFEGKTVLLGCVHMPGHHTGDSIREMFDLCVSKWKISDGIIRIVSDNASNMLNAFQLPSFSVEFEVVFANSSTQAVSGSGNEVASDNLVTAVTDASASVELDMQCENIQDDEGEEHTESDIASITQSAFFTSKIHLSCPIHTLQLAIKDSFDEVAVLTNKASKLVNSIRRSNLNTAFTDSLGVRPSTACITRWNSQLKMIESVMKLSERDPEFQSKLNIPESTKLTASDLRSLASLVHALQPLGELTDTLQTKFGTLGVVLPSVAEMQRLVGAVKSPLMIRIFAETLMKKVEERFRKYYSDVHLIVAAVLDPRFKTEWILRDNNVLDKVMAIRELVAHHATAAAEAAAAMRAATAAADSRSSSQLTAAETSADQTVMSTESVVKKPRLMFTSYANDQGTSPSALPRTAAEELEVYLSSARLPPTADVLAFWKANSGHYPHLAVLARATYGIPSGSASAERVFSAAGLITRVHRLSMLPQTLEKLVFAKVNSALLL
jgi:hypothetical protein